MSLEAPDEPAQMSVTEANAISQGQSQMFTFLVDDPGPASFTLLYPSGDVDSLVRAIRVVLDDPSRAAAMGVAARQRMAKVFDVERWTDETEALFARVAGVD